MSTLYFVIGIIVLFAIDVVCFALACDPPSPRWSYIPFFGGIAFLLLRGRNRH